MFHEFCFDVIIKTCCFLYVDIYFVLEYILAYLIHDLFYNFLNFVILIHYLFVPCHVIYVSTNVTI